jgi:hypothetical protein
MRVQHRAHQRRELDAEPALGRRVHHQGPDAAGGVVEGPGVPPPVRHQVPNVHPPRGLLQREVPLVGQHERELLLVVRPRRGARGVFHQHQAQGARVAPGEQPEAVVELVVRHVHPRTIARSGAVQALGERTGEEGRRGHRGRVYGPSPSPGRGARQHRPST